jgi:hypothetical protein
MAPTCFPGPSLQPLSERGLLSSPVAQTQPGTPEGGTAGLKKGTGLSEWKGKQKLCRVDGKCSRA